MASDTDRIREFVKENPGSTAWYISKQLGLKSSSVSSQLKREVEMNRMHRNCNNMTATWVYFHGPYPD